MTDEFKCTEVGDYEPEYIEDTADPAWAERRAVEMLEAVTPLTPTPVRIVVADHRSAVDPSEVVWLESGWVDCDRIVAVPCPGCGHVLNQNSHHVWWAWEVLECSACSAKLLHLLPDDEMLLWRKRVSATYTDRNSMCDAIVSALTSLAEGSEVIRIDRVVLPRSCRGCLRTNSISISLIVG